MKKLWLHIVRTYLRTALFFYFKKFEIHGIENVPKDKPILFLGNHQSALIDALLIATRSGRFTYFLTRASVFKNSLAGKLLKSLQMLPVYRVRDGWSSLSNNKAIFDNCSELLLKKEAVSLFPEGNHNLERRVRKLSKGFTRIVFDTLEKYPELDLQLIPVGINYLDGTCFPDSTSMYLGKALSAQSFVHEDRNVGVVNLKSRIRKELSELTTNIPEENYQTVLAKLDDLNVNYLRPHEVNNCIQTNFENCSKRKKPSNKGFKSLLKGLLILNILLPYLVWKFIVSPKIKEPEFIATFRFAVAITLVPIYLIIIAICIALLISLSVSLIYLSAVILLMLLVVKL